MQFFIKNLIKFVPNIIAILILVIVQMLFIGTNIIGSILFARLFIYRKLYNNIILVTLASLLYDAIKMIPLGSWSLSFYVIALPVLGLLHIFKVQNDRPLYSWPTALTQVGIVSFSALSQSYVLMKISGQHTFNFTNAYSIVTVSTLYILFLKFTHKKDRKILLY